MTREVWAGIYERSGDVIGNQVGGNSSSITTWGIGSKNVTFSEINSPNLINGSDYYLIYTTSGGSGFF